MWIQNCSRRRRIGGHPFAKTLETFRHWIKQLWFAQYSRARGIPDTSGFEHIFMGEFKKGEVSGMHSWLRYYLLERNASQQLHYLGFSARRANVMATVKFTWKNNLKPSGSFFIGSSPEFEMAVDTLCFLTSRPRGPCKFELEQCPFSMTSYDLIQKEKLYIGTIYPTAGKMTDTCRRCNINGAKNCM
ncbi:unnamed protein product [Gongylonema pulchrum]|uniref:Endoribonuclease n=1 Tax=Gongylonema pulchrum TaxID=637853 RepID=A0A183DQM2_9BILA|nr:unnamed protein product [Gongylonema pulchrum]